MSTVAEALEATFETQYRAAIEENAQLVARLAGAESDANVETVRALRVELATAAAVTKRLKQCGGEAELARRNWATPVCFKCVPPPPPLKRQAACAAPTHHAFDIDIYDCPCGHMYGDHEYRWTGGNDHGNVMDIVKCSTCEAANG